MFNTLTESQRLQQSWHGLQISISKEISACILPCSSPVASWLQPSSHSRNARFRIVSFGHTLLFFALFQQHRDRQCVAFMLQHQKQRSEGVAPDELVKCKMQSEKNLQNSTGKKKKESVTKTFVMKYCRNVQSFLFCF